MAHRFDQRETREMKDYRTTSFVSVMIRLQQGVSGPTCFEYSWFVDKEIGTPLLFELFKRVRKVDHNQGLCLDAALSASQRLGSNSN